MGWTFDFGDGDNGSTPETNKTDGVKKGGYSFDFGGDTESETEKVIKALTGKKLDLVEKQLKQADRFVSPERPLPKNIVTGNTQFLSPLTPFEDVGKNVIPQSAITPMANGYDGSGTYIPYSTEINDATASFEKLPSVEDTVNRRFNEKVDAAMDVLGKEAKKVGSKEQVDWINGQIKKIDSDIQELDQAIANTSMSGLDVSDLQEQKTTLLAKRDAYSTELSKAEELWRNNPENPEYRTDEQKALTAEQQTRLDEIGKRLDELSVMAGYATTDPNAGIAITEETNKLKAEAAQLLRANRDLKAPSAMAGSWAGGAVMKGVGSFDQSVTEFLDKTLGLGYLLGEIWAMHGLDPERNPITALNRRIHEDNAKNAEYFGTMTQGNKGAQTAMNYGQQTVAAIPAAILAYMTAGSSMASTAGLTSSAYLNSLSGAEQTVAMVGEAVKQMTASPNFLVSFMQESGNSYESALNAGMSSADAAMYSMLYAYIAAMVEVGGTSELAGGTQQFAQKVAEGPKGVIPGLADYAKSIVGEMGEEAVQGMLERGLQAPFGVDTALYSNDPNQNAIIKPNEMLEEAKGAAIVSALMGGPGAIVNTVNSIQQNQNAEAPVQEAPAVNTPAEVTTENAPAVNTPVEANPVADALAPIEQTSIDANNVSEQTQVNTPVEQSAVETQNNAENEGTVTRAEPAPTEPAGVMKRSQVESNTLQHLAEETGGQQGELYYPSYTEKQTLAAAQSRVSQDFTGEMNTLTDKASWSSTDVDSAFLIQGILQTDGVKTGDFSAAQAWSKVVKDRISRSAQALQAVAKWSRTGEAVFTNAIEEMAKTGLSTEEQGRVLTDIEKFAKRYDETTLRNGDRTALDDKEIRQLILDMNAYRKTGTFGKNNFEKVLSQIKDVDWLHEFALRQLMAIPADYTNNPSLAQQLKTWQVNSQLSRLGTFFRNIGGNLAFGVQDTLAQDAFGIAIDALVSKATGVREVGLDKGWLSSKARQGARDAMLKSILEVSADVDMAGEGSKYGNNTNRTNKMTGSGFSRFMSRWEQLLGYSLTTSDRTSRGQIEEAVSEGVMNANRGLTGVNNFVADQVINDNKLANAFTKATGVQLTGDRKIDRGLIKENASQLLNIGDLSAVPYGNALLDTLMQNQMTADRAAVIADQSADYRLFQNRGTAVKISKGLHDVLNYIGVKDANGNSFGLGDLINAYPGVPANLAVKSLEYSPANIVKGGIELVKLLSDVKHGVEVDVGRQHQAVMDIARGLSGVPAIALLTALFRSGAVKNADDEKDLDASSQKAAEGRTGVQVNLSAAMRLLKGESGEWRDGDDLMSIGYLEPLNAFMAIASLVAEDTEEDPTLKSFAKSTYNHYIEGSIQSILDMPVMSNISSLIDTFKYSTAESIGEKAVEGTIEFAGNALSGMIPAPVSQLAKATDDTMRSTKGDTKLESVVNGILSNIPGLRQTLDPKLDAFGQEKKYAGTDLQRWLNTFVLPGSISEMNQTETGRLIERLYEDTGDPSVYPDRKAPKSFSVPGAEKLKLNTEQQFQYQTVYGQTAAQLVTDFMNGSGYDDLTSEQRVEIVNKLYGFAKNDAENAILEAAGMEPKGNSEYEKAKAVMDVSGMSWADFFTFDSGVPKKQSDLAKFLVDSDFTAEQQEAIYDIYNTGETPFSEYRDKEQAAHDNGWESADVQAAMLADVKAFKEGIKNEYDSKGNIEAAEYIRNQDLTDQQKDSLIGEASKDFKDYYDVIRGNDVSANDTIDLLIAIDATPTKSSTPNNGSISQSELIAYYQTHPEDEWLIAALWNSQDRAKGDWDTAKAKNFK